MSSAISSTPSRTQSPVSNSEQAFPAFFRRERTPPPTVENLQELPNDKGDHATSVSTPPDNHSPPSGRTEKERIKYKPIPERRMLGYMSTAALIINKMIGTGIFSKPSSVLANTGSKGASMFLWVTGGIMTLSGYVSL